jgi:hypothetical protein
LFVAFKLSTSEAIRSAGGRIDAIFLAVESGRSKNAFVDHILLGVNEARAWGIATVSAIFVKIVVGVT